MNIHPNQQSIFRLQHASTALQKRSWLNNSQSLTHTPVATFHKKGHLARLHLASAVLIALGIQPKRLKKD